MFGDIKINHESNNLIGVLLGNSDNPEADAEKYSKDFTENIAPKLKELVESEEGFRISDLFEFAFSQNDSIMASILLFKSGEIMEHNRMSSADALGQMLKQMAGASE